jgi:hypothetical protein
MRASAPANAPGRSPLPGPDRPVATRAAVLAALAGGTEVTAGQVGLLSRMTESRRRSMGLLRQVTPVDRQWMAGDET